MNYFVFLPASEAKNLKDKRRSVYQSDYLDIRLKREMSDEEESNEILQNDNENDDQEEQQEEVVDENDTNEQEEIDENETNEQEVVQENDGTNGNGMSFLMIKILSAISSFICLHFSSLIYTF